MSKKLRSSLAFISIVVITLLLYQRSRLCSSIYALGGFMVCGSTTSRLCRNNKTMGPIMVCGGTWIGLGRNNQAMGRLLVHFSNSLPSDSNWSLVLRCHNSFISSCYFCWHLFTIIGHVGTSTLTTLGFLNMYNTISICISNWLWTQK
jgi:hypothetical protein